MLEQNARIRHFTVIRGLDRVHLGASSVIGSLNWITGIPTNWDEPVLEDYPDRRAELVLGESAGITSRHYIDCSDAVVLGSFALIAGVRCVLLTHHLNVHRARQGCAPIRIGEYSLVSTNCVLLGGASLPDRCILGAGSLLLRDPHTTHRLYVGIPAREVKEYEEDHAWFRRTRLRTF